MLGHSVVDSRQKRLGDVCFICRVIDGEKRHEIQPGFEPGSSEFSEGEMVPVCVHG